MAYSSSISTSAPALKTLFAGAMIPHGKNGTDHEQYDYTAKELEAFEALSNEMAETIATGNPVRIYFDNDGTLFRFVPDPKDVTMDRDCYAGLVRLSQFTNVVATSLTGRDVYEARDLMLTPGYEVRNAKGNLIAAEGDKSLRFAITGSHGVENLTPEGEVERFDFGASKGFITAFQAESAALRQQYPGILVEDKKHGAVGINVATVTDASTQQQAYDAALAILQRYESASDNPPHPETGQKIFQIRREGNNELEMRPVGFGKDFGIRTFGNPDKKAMTLFLCDSLGDQGTDRPAAELINNPDYFENGNVLLVRNGRNQPTSDESPYHARVAFANPTLLGKFLCHVATIAEHRLDLKQAPKVDHLKPR